MGKLRVEQVEQLRHLASMGLHPATLAALFNVSRMTVSRLLAPNPPKPKARDRVSD